jgi:hypothetical protein
LLAQEPGMGSCTAVAPLPFRSALGCRCEQDPQIFKQPSGPRGARFAPCCKPLLL